MSDRAQQSDGDDVTLAADIARWSADARLAPLFAVRGGALWFGWTFPTYKHKPGRHPDDVM